MSLFFFFQAEDGIRDKLVTGVQTCALPISVHIEESGVQAHISSLRDQRPAQYAARAETAGELGPRRRRETLTCAHLREDSDRLRGVDPADAVEVRAEGHHQLPAQALERRVRR